MRNDREFVLAVSEARAREAAAKAWQSWAWAVFLMVVVMFLVKSGIDVAREYAPPEKSELAEYYKRVDGLPDEMVLKFNMVLKLTQQDLIKQSNQILAEQKVWMLQQLQKAFDQINGPIARKLLWGLYHHDHTMGAGGACGVMVEPQPEQGVQDAGIKQ